MEESDDSIAAALAAYRKIQTRGSRLPSQQMMVQTFFVRLLKVAPSIFYHPDDSKEFQNVEAY